MMHGRLVKPASNPNASEIAAIPHTARDGAFSAGRKALSQAFIQAAPSADATLVLPRQRRQDYTSRRPILPRQAARMMTTLVVVTCRAHVQPLRAGDIVGDKPTRFSSL